MIKDVVVPLLTTTINRYSDTKVLPADAVCRELTDILEYVADLKEEDKEPITVVLSEINCKCEIYKQALEEVLSNLVLIDGPNPADSYIDESIERIKKLWRKQSEK